MIQPERRLILKFKGATPPSIKMLIKAQGGFWDDLFDAWNCPITANQNLGFLEDKISRREMLLPSPDKTGRYQMGKYATLLKSLHNQSSQIIKDAERYEQEYVSSRRIRGIDVDFRTWSEFGVEPTDEDKSVLEYECEKLLYQRIKEITALRAEIDQIHEELKGMKI